MKTVKRKAKQGERILITKPWNQQHYYKKGDIFTAARVNVMHTNVLWVDGIPIGIVPKEYEVIVEENEQ